MDSIAARVHPLLSGFVPGEVDVPNDYTDRMPFGHSCRVVRRVRLPQKRPLDPTHREETITVRRRGTRKTLERAVGLVRGFIRVDGEIEAYTAQEWVRVFGRGNELGTSHGLVSVH